MHGYTRDVVHVQARATLEFQEKHKPAMTSCLRPCPAEFFFFFKATSAMSASVLNFIARARLINLDKPTCFWFKVATTTIIVHSLRLQSLAQTSDSVYCFFSTIFSNSAGMLSTPSYFPLFRLRTALPVSSQRCAWLLDLVVLKDVSVRLCLVGSSTSLYNIQSIG